MSSSRVRNWNETIAQALRLVPFPVVFGCDGSLVDLDVARHPSDYVADAEWSIHLGPRGHARLAAGCFAAWAFHLIPIARSSRFTFGGFVRLRPGKTPPEVCFVGDAARKRLGNGLNELCPIDPPRWFSDMMPLSLGKAVAFRILGDSGVLLSVRRAWVWPIKGERMAADAKAYGVIRKTLKKRTFFTPLSSDKSSEFRRFPSVV